MYYYNINNLNRNSNSRISNALLIYGYTNFSLEILKYCDNKYLAEKEQYNIYLFQPEYNISLKRVKYISFFNAIN